MESMRRGPGVQAANTYRLLSDIGLLGTTQAGPGSSARASKDAPFMHPRVQRLGIATSVAGVGIADEPLAGVAVAHVALLWFHIRFRDQIV